MVHAVGLVPYDNQVHAWVLDLPGCIAGGRNAEELAGMLPLVIAEHLAWLREHGEVLDSSTAWEVVETIDPRVMLTADGDFCFAAEMEPQSRADLETGIARMEYARSDLLGVVHGLPDVLLDWAPPSSAVEAFDAWAPEVRTIRDIVAHVFSFEVFYRDGLRDGPAKGILEPVTNAAAERATTVALLRSLDDEQRARVYGPVRPGRATPGRWTVRKLLRRMISHERAHTAEILQRRTWLLLGVPDRSAGRIQPA